MPRDCIECFTWNIDPSARYLDAGLRIYVKMLDEATVRELLSPFELGLSSNQICILLAYLDLLMRWNKRINLTSIRTAEEAVSRHFGESLFLARRVQLSGSLLDVGSGAGFPGLALRIVFPDIQTTLLEPVAKKRAFLKEVARTCGFGSVEVRPERLEDFVRLNPSPVIGTLTARAVGDHRSLVLEGAKVIRPGGLICLWVGHEQGRLLGGFTNQIHWEDPAKIPMGREREIWIGNYKPI